MQDISYKLNVGGTSFRTFKSTLSSSGFFSSLLVRDDLVLNEQGEVFVDRNGALFEPILDFLRTDQITVTDSVHCLRLKKEAEFYAIPALITRLDNAVHPENFPYSLIELSKLEAYFSVDYEEKAFYIKPVQCEVIAMLKYVKKVYVCPRNICIHNNANQCGQKCRRRHDPNAHGPRFIDVTMVLVATKHFAGTFSPLSYIM
ncbi:BTB/POZ protein [Sporodiniella umbellata]|nr:BTB/POZ protein [Sporodiniella umbellata]